MLIHFASKMGGVILGTLMECGFNFLFFEVNLLEICSRSMWVFGRCRLAEVMAVTAVFVRLQSWREGEGENANPADYRHSDLIQLSRGTRTL